MAKKKNDDDVDEMGDKLVSDVGYDRAKLSAFFDKLLQVEDVCMVAEQVAKIADALTKQNHLRADVLKARLRVSRTAKPDDVSSDYDEIGNPFLVEEGGN